LSRIDRQMIDELSVKTAFHVDTIEKVYRLTEILREVNEINSIKRNVVLKGGTAINFLYFDIPRLSVDIDLDYIGSVEREEMLEDKESLEKILSRLFKKLGYIIKTRGTYALLQYILNYENSAGNNDRIKVEINFFNRIPILDPVEKIFINFFEFKEFKVSTLAIEDLFGRKLRALMTRATARDLYDVYRLLESNIEFDIEMLRECFIFYLCCHGDPRNVNLEILDNITHLDVKTTLLPLLRKGNKVKIEDMKKVVKPLVKDFLSFNKTEKEFISELFDRKTYIPDLLFQWIDYNRRIKEHPGIKWRIQNM